MTRILRVFAEKVLNLKEMTVFQQSNAMLENMQMIKELVSHAQTNTATVKNATRIDAQSVEKIKDIN